MKILLVSQTKSLCYHISVTAIKTTAHRDRTKYLSNELVYHSAKLQHDCSRFTRSDNYYQRQDSLSVRNILNIYMIVIHVSNHILIEINTCMIAITCSAKGKDDTLHIRGRH